MRPWFDVMPKYYEMKLKIIFSAIFDNTPIPSYKMF